MSIYLRGKLNLNFINRNAGSFYKNNNQFLTINIGKCYSELASSNRSLHLNKCYPTKNKFIFTSTNKRPVTTLPRTPLSVTSNDEKREFMAVFPDIVRDLTEDNMYLELPEVPEYYTKLLQYNVPDGKKGRCMAIIEAYRSFTPVEEHTPENIRLSYIVGWCIEILQAFVLMVDDIIDNSITRRGRLCWFKNEGVGSFAINDAILIESGVYNLLRKHIKNQKYYVPMMELLHDIALKTTIGQLLDAKTANTFTTSKLEKYNIGKHMSMTKYKTSYGFLYFPLAAAIHMAGINDDEIHRQVKTILLEMGHYYQVQNDYLDCFGDPDKTGKIGSDIRDAKCSWLIIMASQRANAEQKKILEECYGVNDEEKENAVKEIYKQLDIPGLYATYDKETYNKILTLIQKIPSRLPNEVFLKYLDKLFKYQW